MKILIFSLIILVSVFICSCSEDSGPTASNNQGTSNHAPELPKNPFPHNDTTGVSRILTISWESTDPDAGDTVKFDVYMSNDNPPANVLISNLLTSSYNVPYLLNGNTLYYWRVVAKDNHGAVTSGNVWQFTTGATY